MVHTLLKHIRHSSLDALHELSTTINEYLISLILRVLCKYIYLPCMFEDIINKGIAFLINENVGVLSE